MYCVRPRGVVNPSARAKGVRRQGGRLGLGSTTGKPRHLTHAQAKVKPSAPQGELEFTSHDLSREDAHGEEEPKIKVNVDVSKVKSFLMNVVKTTEIAELDLQMGDMELYVLRKVASSAAAAPPAPAPAAPAPAAAAAAPVAMSSLEEASEPSVDETIVCLQSETVGTFRRGRYAKGKKIGSKPCVEVGTQVKKGQTVAFVEQMGTYAPVLANQAGEVHEFLVQEGDPVGFGQDLVSLYPFFGGHIIGESKHV